MKVAVLGTGVVGETLARKLVELGHDVLIGTRDPSSGPDVGARLATFQDAAAGVDLVVLALSGAHALDVVQSLDLAGLVVLDATNPLDFSHGMPPTLSVFGTDSLGEQVQRAQPRARVVKALNTVSADVMVDPSLVPHPQTLFLAGDDDGAKDEVRALLRTFGWTDDAFLDLGGIVNARATEAYVLLWVAMYAQAGTPHVGVRAVRA